MTPAAISRISLSVITHYRAWRERMLRRVVSVALAALAREMDRPVPPGVEIRAFYVDPDAPVERIELDPQFVADAVRRSGADGAYLEHVLGPERRP